MNWDFFRNILFVIQHSILFIGVFIVLVSALISAYRYLAFYFSSAKDSAEDTVNSIRIYFARQILLGLEFIIAADLIGTTSTPDYYALGMLAIIILIRTVLSFSLNKEIASMS